MSGMKLRFSSVVLLIYLSILADSIATAHTVVGVIENNNEAKGVDKVQIKALGLQYGTRKWLWGRKMSAVALEKEMETGQPRISENLVLDSTLKMHDKIQESRRMRVLKSKPTATVKKNTKKSSVEMIPPDSFRKSEAKEQLDAVTEMHNMVHMDYQRRARRRPPINNDMPLKEDSDVKP